MRVLILSAAVLAYATAAPSGALISPIIPGYALPVAIPTISSGDIQAAAINAKVLAEDQAIAAADRARQLAEQAVENTNDKVIEANDLAKEKSGEAIWSSEDQKWQTLNAIQTVEAKIDGAAANNAEILAKSALGGVVLQTPVIAPVATPLVAPIAPVSPLLYASTGSISPGLVSTGLVSQGLVSQGLVSPGLVQPGLVSAGLVSPGLVAPEIKSISTESLAQAKTVQAKAEEEKEKSEATVKTADVGVKAAESAEVKSTEPVQIGIGNVKAIETVQSGDKFLAQTLTQTHPVVGNLALAPGLKLAQPWVASPVAYIQPGASYSTSSVQQLHGQYLTPTLIKTQW